MVELHPHGARRGARRAATIAAAGSVALPRRRVRRHAGRGRGEARGARRGALQALHGGEGLERARSDCAQARTPGTAANLYVGFFLCQSVTRWYASAVRRSATSANGRPTSWKPIGSPLASNPAGTLIAGSPR